jgi:hypothetical protein
MPDDQTAPHGFPAPSSSTCRVGGTASLESRAEKSSPRIPEVAYLRISTPPALCSATPRRSCALLAADPANATAKGGPRQLGRAEPHLCCSKYSAARAAPQPSGFAQGRHGGLRDAGADPNPGFFA